MEGIAQLLPLLVIVVLFWLLLIRPAQRRQRQALAIQRSADVGAEIMLTSGIFGRVTGADEETLQVELAPGTVVKVARGAVGRVLSDEQPTGTEPADTHDGPEGQ